MREFYLNIIKEECPTAWIWIIQKFLDCLSKIYGFVIRTRIFFYRSGILRCIRIPATVISIGNITTGGTGKTPLIEYISKFILSRGQRKIAILSRGYAAKITKENVSKGCKVFNDEYLVLAENIPGIPVLLNSNRVKSGLKAIEWLQTEYIILDDGFQHIRLARDLEIVIIDALNPFGYEYLIPRGLLREPLEGLKRADMIVLTHVDQCHPEMIGTIIKRLMKIASNISIVETIHKPIYVESIKNRTRFDTSCLHGKKVFAFCALGNPYSFRKNLESLGAELLDFRIFPDHHIYTTSDLNMLNAEARRINPDVIVTTQKDNVKLKDTLQLWDFPLWMLKIEICIVKGKEIFEEKMNQLFNRRES